MTTVVLSLAAVNCVERLNFYILDFGNNALTPLRTLPHVADYISLDDEERFQKFLRLIKGEMAYRKKQLAKKAVQNFEIYNQMSEEQMKAIFIIIDNADAIKEMGFEMEEEFTVLTRDGSSLGIYVVMTATRGNAVRQATLNNFKNKIAGFNFDENEVRSLMGRSQYKLPEIKGRTMVKTGEINCMQFYSMVQSENELEYSEGIRKLVGEIRSMNAGKEAPHIPTLPEEFYSGMLEEYGGEDREFYIGLEKENVVKEGFFGGETPFVILGENSRGKTNMLQVILDQISDDRQIYLFDSPGMELYAYGRKENVTYVNSQEEAVKFREAMEAEIRQRRQKLQEALETNPGVNPKLLLRKTDAPVIIMDDVDNFITLVKTDMNKQAALLRDAVEVGIPWIVTVYATRTRGIDEVNRLVKQASNGLVLGSQGVSTIFPTVSTRDVPEMGSGLLFKNGSYRKVRLPKWGQQGMD